MVWEVLNRAGNFADLGSFVMDAINTKGIWGFSRLFQSLRGRRSSEASAMNEAGQDLPAPKNVPANKAMADEAHELHALLKAMSNQNDKTGIFYEIPPDKFWIMQTIWTHLPKGAVKKLFDVFATEIVTRKHSKVTGWTKHPTPEGGKPRPDTPEREEVTAEENVMGPQLINGLVWYAVQAQKSPKVPDVPQGTNPDLKGVLYVVEMLKSSQRLSNLEDDLASGTEKAAAIAARKAAEGDTFLHRLMLIWKMGWRDAQEIWNLPHAQALRNQADQSGDPREVRRLHESLQKYLQAAAKLVAEEKQSRQAGIRRWLQRWGWFITGLVVLAAFITIPGLPIN